MFRSSKRRGGRISGAPGGLFGGLVLGASLFFGTSLLVGCSESPRSEEKPATDLEAQASIPGAGGESRSAPQDPRPSVVLIVLDTLRADAVSAYGAVAETTPNLDRLAADGLQYQHAFSPSPWTLPSHATLFTGLDVKDHGVGMGQQLTLPDSLTTLAEHLRDAGYQTAGFSENFLVSEKFGLTQGFDRFEWPELKEILENQAQGVGRLQSFNILKRIQDWLKTLDPDKPFFLFVNIYDIHAPYEVDLENDFLAPGIDPAHAQRILDRYPMWSSNCSRLPPEEALSVLKSLYLGGVRRADTKLGEILDSVASKEGLSPPITVVTSDHGESLGEHKLLGHRFSVRNQTLQIPLFVHGLPEVPPAVLDVPVGLIDMRSSIECWTKTGSCANSIPVVADVSREGDSRKMVSFYSDESVVQEHVGQDGELKEETSRSSCAPSDLVFGRMASLTDYPMKFIWFESGETFLYDLSWDQGELSDQKSLVPEQASSMLAELKQRMPTDDSSGASGSVGEWTVDPESVEALRELGYVE